jgi:hypothetical protein
MDEKQAEQSFAYLADFAKMVKKQLRKAYNKDARRVSQKVDLHDQPKAILKIGAKDGFELWFRKADDGSIVIDKIAGGKAAGTLKINVPVCHLRTSALLVDKFDIPDKKSAEPKEPVDENKVDGIAEQLVNKIAALTGQSNDAIMDLLVEDPESFLDEYKPKLPDELRESLESIAHIVMEEIEDASEEPEDFEEEFVTPSNKFAIVDASVLEGIDNDNELVDQAIIVPTKHRGAVFNVVANYDDTILRNLTVEPSEYKEGDVDVVKTTNYAVKEGAAPLSHDSTLRRKIRKHTSIKQKHHMKNAKNVPLRIKDVSKKVQVKRDKSHKDQRMKQRQAEDIDKKKTLIQTLLEHNDHTSTLSVDELKFAKTVMDKLSGMDFLPDKVHAAQSSVDSALRVRGTTEAKELVEFVEWIQKNPIKSLLNT